MDDCVDLSKAIVAACYHGRPEKPDVRRRDGEKPSEPASIPPRPEKLSFILFNYKYLSMPFLFYFNDNNNNNNKLIIIIIKKILNNKIIHSLIFNRIPK